MFFFHFLITSIDSNFQKSAYVEVKRNSFIIIFGFCIFLYILNKMNIFAFFNYKNTCSMVTVTQGVPRGFAHCNILQNNGDIKILVL